MNKKKRMGFAVMVERDPAHHATIAAKGGVAAHANGTAHQFDSTEAAAAGRVGGLRVSQDRAHMAEIGRLGAAGRKAHREQRALVASLAAARVAL